MVVFGVGCNFILQNQTWLSKVTMGSMENCYSDLSLYNTSIHYIVVINLPGTLCIWNLQVCLLLGGDITTAYPGRKHGA